MGDFDRDAYLDETDKLLGLPPGFSRAQIQVESNFNPKAVSPVGAQGLAQVMPSTLAALNKRQGGRNLDPFNERDALQMQRELMQENLGRFKNPDDAARAYNGGWDQSKWGNKETAAYANKIRAAMGGSPKSPMTDDPLAGLGNPDEIAFARSQGYSDAEIAKTLGNEKAKLKSDITRTARSDVPAEQLLNLLGEAGYKDEIKFAKQQGYSATDILNKLGQDDAAKEVIAQKAASDRGFLGNARKGLGYEVDSLKRGAQQIGAGLTGDDARLQQLRDEKRAVEDSPDYRATDRTAGGFVGQAAPGVAADVGAALLTGGGSLGATALRRAGVQAATNAAYFGARDTAEDGDRLKNAAIGGVAGAAGSLGADALAALPGAAMKGAGAAMRGGRSPEDLAATLAAYEKAGIPVSAADLSPTIGAINKRAGDVPFATTLGGKGNAQAQQEALIKGVLKEIGEEGTSLDSSVIARAQKNIGAKFDNVYDGVTVKPSDQLSSDLAAILKAEKENLPSLQSKRVQDVVAELQSSLGKEVPATQLQALRSRLIKQSSGMSVDPIEKEALGNVKGAIERELERNIPADRAALHSEANRQWRHLQAAENMVRATNDGTKDLTGAIGMSAIKQGRNRAAFERGEAPYQDLMKLAASLPRQGAADGSDGLLKAGGLAYMAHNPIAALGVPIAAGARRLAQSTNPAIRNRLLGVPVESAENGPALAAALGGTATAKAPDPTGLVSALQSKADQATTAAGLTGAPPSAPVAPVATQPQAQAMAQATAQPQALAAALAERHAANAPVFKGKSVGPQGNPKWLRSQAARSGISPDYRARLLAKAEEIESRK